MTFRDRGTADAFARGVELFNGRRYFVCHEVWEGIWLRAGGVEKIFLQGLIQAAAALLHLERGNPRGAESVWRKARTKLAGLPSPFMDIALAEFIAELDYFVENNLHRRHPDESPRLTWVDSRNG